MAPGQPRRWTLSEYGAPKPIVGAIAAAAGMEPARVRELLLDAGRRVAGALGLKEQPLQIMDGSVQATGFAGLLLLNHGIEIEIVPKFLDPSEAWREDFFLMAVLARHGHLLEEHLSASPTRESDLAVLVGRALASLYWRHHRRPIRSYETQTSQSMELEGDYDAVDLLYPETEGYTQAVTSLTRRNHHNGAIAAAAALLAPAVRDAEVRLNLERVVRHLPRQPVPRRGERKRLPGRASSWRSTYELALDVLEGLGGSYVAATREVPGYVVNTWRAWESLLTITMRQAFGAEVVAAQHAYGLGSASRGGGHRIVSVTPDIVISGTSPFIIDAKYKGRIGRGPRPTLAADLYEALAFARATKIQRVILAYPWMSRDGDKPRTGDVSVLEIIKTGDTTVIAVEIAVAGIATRGGLARLAGNAKSGLVGIVSKP